MTCCQEDTGVLQHICLSSLRLKMISLIMMPKNSKNVPRFTSGLRTTKQESDKEKV